MFSPTLTTGSPTHSSLPVVVVVVIWRWESHCVAQADLVPLYIHDSLISASHVAGMTTCATMPGIHFRYAL